MPKEKVQMRSKRAASKQALNRLQHILVDDDDDVQVRISSDDDDVGIRIMYSVWFLYYEFFCKNQKKKFFLEI